MRRFLVLLFALPSLAACTKPIVQGKERPIAPITRTFHSPVKETFEASAKALQSLGYQIREEDPAKGFLRTAWRATQAASHYTDLFDQKDYGTVGSYYRVILKVRETKGGSEVEVSTPVKSLIAHQQSSTREERRIFRKIADLLRPDNFEMTNLGVE